MHACLKFEFTEGDKCHNFMSRLILLLSVLKRIKLSHVTRKPVFGVCDQVRHKPLCSAKEDS